MFSKPVSTDEAPNYHEMIPDPIDLGMMRDKVDNACYSTWEALFEDFELMISNALTYNHEGIHHRQAKEMNKECCPSTHQLPSGCVIRIFRFAAIAIDLRCLCAMLGMWASKS